jgi:hypothetical protein
MSTHYIIISLTDAGFATTSEEVCESYHRHKQTLCQKAVTQKYL